MEWQTTESTRTRNKVYDNNIDVFLLSKSLFTQKLDQTQHLDSKGHGGTIIIIKDNIKHHLVRNFNKDYLQGTSIGIEENTIIININSLYCPTKHNIRKEECWGYFST